MSELSEALIEFHNIVVKCSHDYTEQELTISTLRREHTELNFLDDDILEDIIQYANDHRLKQRK